MVFNRLRAALNQVREERERKQADARRQLSELKKATDLTDEHSLPEEELEKKLKVKISDGLLGSLEESNSDIWASAKAWGNNSITLKKKKSAASEFFRHQREGFAPLLWGSAILQLIVGFLVNDNESLYVATFQLILSFITGTVVFVESRKTKATVHELNDVEHQYYSIRRNGSMIDMVGADLVVGDIICNLGHTDKVPADIRVLAGTDDLAMDTSVITEEDSTVELRNSEVSVAENPLQAANLIFRGSDLVSGAVKEGMVIRVGDRTQLGRVAQLIQRTEKEHETSSASELETQRCVKFFTLSSVIVSVAAFFLCAINDAAVFTSMKVVAGVAMAMVPSGYLVCNVIVFRLAATHLELLGIEIKDIKTIETLSAVSCVVTGKHGPLTANNTRVVSLVFADEDGEFIEHETSDIVHESKHETFYQLPNAQELHRCAFAASNPETRFVNEQEDVNHTRFKPDGSGKMKSFKKQVHDQKTGVPKHEVMWDAVGSTPEDIAVLKFFHDHPCPFRKHHDTVFDFEESYERYPSLFHSPFSRKTGFEVHVRCVHAGPLQTNGGPRKVYMRGHVPDVLARCSRFRDGKGARGLTPDDIAVIDDTAKYMGANGLTVMAFAESEDLPVNRYPAAYEYSMEPAGYVTPNFPMGERPDEYDCEPEHIHTRSTEGLVFIGLIGFYDDVHEIEHNVQECRDAGIRVVLCTSDPPHAALSLARKASVLWEDESDLDIVELNQHIRDLTAEGYDQDYITRQVSLRLGLPVEEVRQNGLYAIRSPLGCEARVVDVTQCTSLEGSVRPLEQMDDQWWEDLIQHSSQIVFANAVSHHIQLVVSAFQTVGHVVLLTGDSASDALPLASADVGVSTTTASKAAQASSAILMESSHFEGIVEMIKTGRKVFDNLKKTTAFLMSSNVAQLVLFFAFVLFELPVPMATSLVLLIDLAANIPTAVALAQELPEANLMSKPPRHRNKDGVMNFKMVFFAYLQIGVIEAFAALFAYLIVLNDYGFPPHVLVRGAAKDNWGNFPLYCQFDGGHYVNAYGQIDLLHDPSRHAPTRQYPLWDSGDAGIVKKCVHPLRAVTQKFGAPRDFQLTAAASYGDRAFERSVVPVEALEALEANGYFEYIPWASRMSGFWRTEWLSYDIAKGPEMDNMAQIPASNSREMTYEETWNFYSKMPLGLYSICAEDPYLTHHDGKVSAVTDAQIESLSGFRAPDSKYSLCADSTAEKSAMFKEGRAYSRALFCNGDGYLRNVTAYGVTNNYISPSTPWSYADDEWQAMDSVSLNSLQTKQAKCAVLDDHPKQVQYCRDTCDYRCESIPSHQRYNYTKSQEQWTRQCVSIASRMTQHEAHYHARMAAFVAIVICQLGALIAIKTRWLSIIDHGFANPAINISVFFLVLFAAWTSYSDVFNKFTLTRPLRFTHFLPGMPWACVIVIYDEIRKLLIRRTSSTDKIGDTERRVTGWLETNMYY